MFLFHPAQGCRNVVGRHQGEFQVIFLSLDFPVGHGARLEVGHGCAEDGCIGLAESLGCRLVHLLAAFHVDAVDGWAAAQGHRTGDEGYVSATAQALLGEGESHLARGIVADETHGVYLLVGRARRDHHLLA